MRKQECLMSLTLCGLSPWKALSDIPHSAWISARLRTLGQFALAYVIQDAIIGELAFFGIDHAQLADHRV